MISDSQDRSRSFAQRVVRRTEPAWLSQQGAQRSLNLHTSRALELSIRCGMHRGAFEAGPYALRYHLWQLAPHAVEHMLAGCHD